MATRKIVPRADNEGGLGTALKRWASAFINALTANSATIGTLEGIVKAAAGVLSATALGTARQIFGMNDAGTAPAYMTFPKFSAHKNAINQTGIVTDTATKVTFNTELYDIGNTYDAPNSKWTPGVIGKAHMDVNIYWTASVADKEFDVVIYKNGADIAWVMARSTGIGTIMSHASLDVSVDAITDYFEIYCYQGSGSNKDIGGTIVLTWLMGHMLV